MATGTTLEVMFVSVSSCLSPLDSICLALGQASGSGENKQEVLPYGVSGSQAWRQVSGSSTVWGNDSFFPL